MLHTIGVQAICFTSFNNNEEENIVFCGKNKSCLEYGTAKMGEELY